jgi:hypothetical protein
MGARLYMTLVWHPIETGKQSPVGLSWMTDARAWLEPLYA